MMRSAAILSGPWASRLRVPARVMLAIFLAGLLSSPARAAEAMHPPGLDFGVKDAALLLGVPESDVTGRIQEQYVGLWMCSFQTSNGKESFSFSVTVSPSAADAEADLAQYRSNLELAGETAPFKDDPAGAYSDITLGDEAVWSNINGTLTVRKGHLTIQILQPSDKTKQLRLAQALLAKM